MTLSAPLLIAIAVAAPLLALVVTARVKRYRRRAAPAVADDTAGSKFETKAEPKPAFLLRRFSLSQRTYLAEQYGAAWICFTLCTYVLFVTASLGLLPGDIHAAIHANVAQQVWQNYRNQLTVAGYVAEVFAFVASVVVITTLKTPSYAIFNRTRPLSSRFLFRGRAFIILASLLAATQAALLASILLLTLIYGPLWKLVSVHAGSILRLDLSMLTTTALVFSIFVFLSFVPVSWPLLGEKKWIPIVLASAAGSQTVFFCRFLLATPAARALFLFPAQSPPNSYALALVPLACIAGLLFFAEHLSTRLEI